MPDHVPERTCIGCRQRAPRAQLVRYVAVDDGRIVRDDATQLPGRGAWLHDDEACRAQAIRKRAIGRALRRPGSELPHDE